MSQSYPISRAVVLMRRLRCFNTNDSFWLNNQRITMDWLREYVATANDSS